MLPLCVNITFLETKLYRAHLTADWNKWAANFNQTSVEMEIFPHIHRRYYTTDLNEETGVNV